MLVPVLIKTTALRSVGKGRAIDSLGRVLLAPGPTFALVLSSTFLMCCEGIVCSWLGAFEYSVSRTSLLAFATGFFLHLHVFARGCSAAGRIVVSSAAGVGTGVALEWGCPITTALSLVGIVTLTSSVTELGWRSYHRPRRLESRSTTVWLPGRSRSESSQ
jgi:hypothetical protein